MQEEKVSELIRLLEQQIKILQVIGSQLNQLDQTTRQIFLK